MKHRYCQGVAIFRPDLMNYIAEWGVQKEGSKGK
jgi:hypothetical protein